MPRHGGSGLSRLAATPMRALSSKLLALSVLALVATGCATTGGVNGTLHGPFSASHGAAGAGPRDAVSDAVVYLEKVPPDLLRRYAQDTVIVVVRQEEHRFVPRVIAVPVGATVRFENHADVYHNVFSVSPARRFDIGKYAPGQSRKVRFDKPGVIKLYDDIDPGMAGFVFVLPHPVFTQPDATGAFTIPQLPKGSYTLKVWHPSLGRLNRTIEMPAKGDLQVDLKF